MHKITPFLWFDDQAEQAARFYTSVFKNSRVRSVSHYGESGHGAAGSVMTVDFEIEGQQFTALNGGPHFKFTEAVSFVVHCDTQEELDYFWNKLSEGGEQVECGWLKDRFGLSWQVVPRILGELITGDNPERANRVMHSLLQMKKLDVQALKDAYNGK